MKRAAVVGAGTMGNGIAHVFAQHGWAVTLVDTAPTALQKANATIRTNLERQVKKGTLPPDAPDQVLSRISSDTNLSAVAESELVIEAASESPAIKFSLFEQLDRICGPEAILASNTSSISITEIAGRTRRPEQVIGMHFMNPVPVMQLVEVIRGHATSDRTTSRVMETAQALGKTPVEVNDYPGFVSNRVLMPMINEAIFCVMEGVAAPEAIDTVMKLGMAHPMGPLALADFIGLDVCLAIMKCCTTGWATTSIVPVRCCGKWSLEGIWAGRPGEDFMTTSKNLGANRAGFGGAVVSALESDLAPRSPRHGSAGPGRRLRPDANHGSRADAAVARPVLRLLRHRRHSRHDTGPGTRRDPVLAIRQHRGSGHRRASALPGHDLQVRGGRHQSRGREVGHHR